MNLKNRPYLEVKRVVNGKIGHRENINKIKFPFYCYYSQDLKHKRLGVVSEANDIYYLIDMAIQKKKREDVDQNENLEKLIIDNNIMLVKVKLIVFE